MHHIPERNKKTSFITVYVNPIVDVIDFGRIMPSRNNFLFFFFTRTVQTAMDRAVAN